MDSNTAWNGHNLDQSASGQDSFQQFMGMDGLDGNASFNFDHFLATQQTSHGHSAQQSPMQHMDATMAKNNHNNHMMGIQKGNMMMEHMPMNGQGNFMNTGNSEMNMAAHGDMGRVNSLVDIDAQIQRLQMQRQLQQQQSLLEQQQNYYVHHRVIPPTPNSMEMQSRESQRNSLQQATHYDASEMQMRQHDMAFTPLGTPAVTPLDTNFNMPEYAMSNFSPLTSPAIHAQYPTANDQSSLYPSSQGYSSTGHSPVEMHLDLPQPASHAAMQRKASSGASSKKAPSKIRTASRAVRQSPIVKPQRRKPTITSISAEVLSELVEPALLISQPTSSHNSSQYGNSVGNSVDCSPENDSISPENLTDMAPPPVPAPRSVKNSPFLMPQNSHPRVQQLISGNSNAAPATPASLMKLARTKEGHASPALDLNMDADQLMEGFSLPDAASPNDALQLDSQVTPTLESSNQTPILSLPPAAISEPTTAMPSPSPRIKAQKESSSAGPTPSSSAVRRTPKLAARGSGRTGSSSVHASPALLPKISPSIKPMVQGQVVSDDTASLLLATKSNYQNILEGTHLPGVSYPSDLSTGLTSRRTIHKLAEQGRRNRINFALQEMAGLLPGAGAPGNKWKAAPRASADAEDREDSGGGGGEEKSKGGTAAASKASTVEQAIEYIKYLRAEVERANKRAEEAEEKLRERGEMDE